MTLLDAVVTIACAAGEAIEDVRRSARIEVAQKPGEGPVTEADRRSDDLLRRELLRLERAAWLSEESVDDAARLSAERVWVVDPLDGTKEFIAGIPEYAVAVGLVERGVAVLGVIHNPATKETYSAARGGGAWMNGTRIATSETGVILASRSEMRAGEFTEFERTGARVQAMGSIAYKLALVAAGRAGTTLSRGPKWEWDVCAGAVLVEEAGGIATDMFGDPLRFNSPRPKVRGVLAGARGMHERMLADLGAMGASARMDEMNANSARQGPAS